MVVNTVKYSIELIFSMALFINALLFIPQSVRILKDKAARDVSLITFLGLLLIQFAIVLHGMIIHDKLLVWGYLLSMLTTGTVVFLVIFFRKKSTTYFSADEILSQLPGHVYWKDKNGIILGSNTNNWMDAGLNSLSDTVGKTDYDFFSKEEADKIRSNDEAVIRSGASMVVEELTTDSLGKKHLYLSHKLPLKDKNNKILGILGVSLDVTDINQEMIDKLEMLDSVVSIMPGKVYWMNRDGVYLGCNENEARAIGLASRRDIVGKRNVDLPGFLIPEALDPVNQKIMTTGESLTLEEPAVLPDGTMGTFISSKVPVYNNRRDVIGLVGISIDITDRKKVEQDLIQAKEQAEAATKLKTEFIQNMQHDIRTPISGIFSLLDSTYRSGDIDEFKRYLPHLLNASRELLDIHNEVIDFENVEYGDKPVYARKFSLFELLHGTVNLNGAAAIVHKSALELKIADSVPDVIKGDDYRLKKILINLIGNAVKFTEHGRIVLCASVVSHKDKQATIRFKVSDTGIGISDDKIHTIFEKFTRLNPSNTGKFKGSGLGLHIVKKFADEIDAELDVKSTLGKGTVFTIDATFDLPKVNQLADEEEHHELSRHLLIDADVPESEKEKIESITSERNATSTKAAPASDVTGAIRICLIEDDVLAMKAVRTILSELGIPCQLTEAVNMTEALEVLKQQQFDAVISDLGLPDGSGFDIAMAIKRDIDHINYKTPFIALTAHSDDEKHQRAKTAGFLAVYNKPLSKIHADKILTDYVLGKNEIDQHIVVDLALSAEAYSGNTKPVIEMVTLLVSAFAKEKPLFENAFKANDFTKARELFHKFRGGISYIRVPEVDKLAMILHDDVKEFEKRNEPLERLNHKLLALFNAMDEVGVWLANYLKQSV
jgi:signal transduction histidine kinase/CheY-like chemotaxis protein/uncharacterized protein with PQ loop repeat